MTVCIWASLFWDTGYVTILSNLFNVMLCITLFYIHIYSLDWSFARVGDAVVITATSIISCCGKIQNGLTFWHQLAQLSWKLAVQTNTVVAAAVVVTKISYYAPAPIGQRH